MKESLYLETSVVSYYVSRLSKNVRVKTHQQITREWWPSLTRFRVYVSPVVLEEVRRGDPDAAEKRLEAIRTFTRLELTPEVERLATVYLAALNIPQKAFRDAAHLAVAAVHKMVYFVTWNCGHLANAQVMKQLRDVNIRRGVYTPIICTPEELMEV